MSTNSARRPHAAPSTWVLKTAMAVTGSVFVLFVLIHLFGNLKVYTGPEHFDSYAHWLRHAFEPFLPAGFVLWCLRIVLVVCLVVHVGAAGILWARARRARGRFRARRVASRTGLRGLSAALMPVTGVALLVFIVVHLLDLTIGATPVASAEFTAATSGTSYAYENLVASFSRPWMAALYVLVMLLLAVHVAHGTSVLASDFGALGHRLRATVTVLGAAVAIAILVGNASIPIAVLLGWVS